jgi:hypothetical protein
VGGGLDAPWGELDFVLRQLPRPGASVLEVGCGAGALTRALSGAGYQIVGIDPEAPDGPMFRSERVEDHQGGPYGAVVAARSLHHVDDLEAVVARVASLAPVLVLAEFGWECFDQPTSAWYEGQRERLIREGREPGGPPASLWREQHDHLHTLGSIRSALAHHFKERSALATPYLSYYLGLNSDRDEAAAIAAAKIAALGFRYVGTSGTSGAH